MVVLDVEVGVGAVVVLVNVVSVDDFEIVPDIAESRGGPGKSRLLGESNSRNGSVGVLFIANIGVVLLVFGLEVVVVVVVVSLDLFAIHCNQLRASFWVSSFSVIRIRSSYKSQLSSTYSNCFNLILTCGKISDRTNRLEN